jgi:transcription elongation factor Elf1
MLLEDIVDSVLGDGVYTSKGITAYHCPFCNHHKKKLEINFTKNRDNTNKWKCWVCDTKGKKIINLFKKLKVHSDKLKELISITKDKNIDFNPNESKKEIISLPEEFISLKQKNQSFSYKKAFN